MREARRNYFATGIFVLLMLAALLLWLAVLAGRTGATDAYYVHFEDVMGLADGAEVRFQGYPVGVVERIRPVEGGGFRVDVGLKRGWRIPADSVARITASGLLSALVVNVETGDSERVLAPGDRIASEEGADLFAELSALAGDVASLVRGVEPALDALTAEVPEIMAEARAFVIRLNDSAERIERLLGEDNTNRVGTILANVGAASANLASISGELGQTRDQLDAILAKVDGIVARSGPDLEAALIDLHDSLDAAARHADAIAYNLESTSRNLNEFSDQVRRNPGVLLRGREQGEEP